MRATVTAGVGETGGGGEEVRRADVCAHRHGHDRRPVPGDQENDEEQPQGGDDFRKPKVGAAAHLS